MDFETTTNNLSGNINQEQSNIFIENNKKTMAQAVVNNWDSFLPTEKTQWYKKITKEHDDLTKVSTSKYLEWKDDYNDETKKTSLSNYLKDRLKIQSTSSNQFYETLFMKYTDSIPSGDPNVDAQFLRDLDKGKKQIPIGTINKSIDYLFDEDNTTVFLKGSEIGLLDSIKSKIENNKSKYNKPSDISLIAGEEWEQYVKVKTVFDTIRDSKDFKELDENEQSHVIETTFKYFAENIERFDLYNSALQRVMDEEIGGTDKMTVLQKNIKTIGRGIDAAKDFKYLYRKDFLNNKLLQWTQPINYKLRYDYVTGDGPVDLNYDEWKDGRLNQLKDEWSKEDKKVAKMEVIADNIFGKAWYGLLGGAPTMGTGIIASAVNPLLGFSYFTATSYNSMKKEMLRQGYDEFTTDNTVAIASPIIAGIESLQALGLSNAAVTSLTNMTWKQVGGLFVKEYLKENLEEATQSTVDIIARGIAAEVDNLEFDGKGEFLQLLKDTPQTALTLLYMQGPSFVVGSGQKIRGLEPSKRLNSLMTMDEIIDTLKVSKDNIKNFTGKLKMQDDLVDEHLQINGISFDMLNKFFNKKEELTDEENIKIASVFNKLQSDEDVKLTSIDSNDIERSLEAVNTDVENMIKNPKLITNQKDIEKIKTNFNSLFEFIEYKGNFIKNIIDEIVNKTIDDKEDKIKNLNTISNEIINLENGLKNIVSLYQYIPSALRETIQFGIKGAGLVSQEKIKDIKNKENVLKEEFKTLDDVLNKYNNSFLATIVSSAKNNKFDLTIKDVEYLTKSYNYKPTLSNFINSGDIYGLIASIKNNELSSKNKQILLNELKNIIKYTRTSFENKFNSFLDEGLGELINTEDMQRKYAVFKNFTNDEIIDFLFKKQKIDEVVVPLRLDTIDFRELPTFETIKKSITPDIEVIRLLKNEDLSFRNKSIFKKWFKNILEYPTLQRAFLAGLDVSGTLRQGGLYVAQKIGSITKNIFSDWNALGKDFNDLNNIRKTFLNILTEEKSKNYFETIIKTNPNFELAKQYGVIFRSESMFSSDAKKIEEFESDLLSRISANIQIKAKQSKIYKVLDFLRKYIGGAWIRIPERHMSLITDFMKMSLFETALKSYPDLIIDKTDNKPEFDITPEDIDINEYNEILEVTPTEEQLFSLATLINNLTGDADFTIKNKEFENALNWILFSKRWTAAQLRNGWEVFKSPITISKALAKKVRGEKLTVDESFKLDVFGNMMLTWASQYGFAMLISSYIDDEDKFSVTLDPMDKNFGKIKYNNFSYDPTFGLSKILAMPLSVIKSFFGQFVETLDIEWYSQAFYTDPENAKDSLYRQLISFFNTKGSTGMNLITIFTKGENAIGQKINWKEWNSWSGNLAENEKKKITTMENLIKKQLMKRYKKDRSLSGINVLASMVSPIVIYSFIDSRLKEEEIAQTAASIIFEILGADKTFELKEIDKFTPSQKVQKLLDPVKFRNTKAYKKAMGKSDFDIKKEMERQTVLDSIK